MSIQTLSIPIVCRLVQQIKWNCLHTWIKMLKKQKKANGWKRRIHLWIIVDGCTVLFVYLYGARHELMDLWIRTAAAAEKQLLGWRGQKLCAPLGSERKKEMNFPIETGIASLSQQQLLDYVERDAWPIRVKTGAIQSSVNNISVKNTIVRGGLRSDCSANSRR